MHHRSGALVCTLAALGVSGCAASPDAADLAGPPDPTAVVVDERRAETAMRSYVDRADAALRSGSTDQLAAVTDGDCPCRELVAYISARFTDGAELVGASFEADAVTVRAREGGQATVRAQVSVSEYDVRSADGLLLRTQAAQDFVADYTLRFDPAFDDPGWRVVDVRQR